MSRCDLDLLAILSPGVETLPYGQSIMHIEEHYRMFKLTQECLKSYLHSLHLNEVVGTSRSKGHCHLHKDIKRNKHEKMSCSL